MALMKAFLMVVLRVDLMVEMMVFQMVGHWELNWVAWKDSTRAGWKVS